MNNTEKDHYYMQLALKEAEKAYAEGEVPVGAVVVRNDVVIASAHNLRETSHDPSAHAEVLALRAAAAASESWRLQDAILYVTKEPCVMCSGTVVNARLARLVYGCSDLKAGGTDSLYQIPTDPRLNHQVEVTSGVLGSESAALLKKFFMERR